MKPIIPLSKGFAVTGALEAADFAEAARLGFKSIVSNLPDGELRHVPSSREAAQLAAEAGLGYRHIPATKFDVLGEAVAGATVAAASDLPGPILAHCASGMRSAVAWGAAAARFQPADVVLASLGKAGFNLAQLESELAAHFDAAAGQPPGPLKIDA